MIQYICLGLSLVLFVSGCQKADAVPPKPEAPSKVTNSVKEDKLTTLELTEAAEKRLGIETARIEMKTLPRRRTYGGEVALPTGATVIVATPMTGRLQSPAADQVPRAGAIVEDKQPFLALFPLLSPAEKIALATQVTDAEGQLQQAQAVVEQRRIDLERAELQSQKGVGLRATLDTAKAQLIQSEKALEAAKVRKNVLDAAINGETSAEQKPFLIEAPQAGIVRAMHVMPGEFVMAGSPLFEVMNVDTVWVRVPIYVGEVADIAADQQAEVGELSSRPGQLRAKAKPIAAPPTATALSSTIDLYYQLPNPQKTLRPGQRVSVQLPLVGDAEQRVVPWSAIVHDIHGGSWIYEKIADHKFVRRRVQVKQIVEDWAVLEQGPPVGTEIVKTGVAEVFGTEFWVQK